MRAQKLGWPTLALLTLALATAGLPGAAEAQQPRRKDTNPRLHPPEVKLQASVEPAVARPGETVTYKVTAVVAEPWHIYAYAEEQPAEGPRSTQFDLFDVGGLEPAGEWTPDHAPKRTREPAFPDLEAVEYYGGQVTWTRKLKVPADERPGAKAVRSQIHFQICNEQACKPPVYISVPEATVEVRAGDDEAAIRPEPKAPGVSGLSGPPDRPGAGPADPRDEQGAAATRLSSFPRGSGLRQALVSSLVFGLIDDAPAADAPATAPSPQPADAAGPGVSAEPATAAALEAPVNVQGAIEQGFFSFLLFSALGGVAALLMPCVWPLVPITVNFFVKQGQRKGGGSTTGLAIVYCLSIIGIFTLLGVLVSVFVGATELNKFATNGWLNLFIAVVFFAFGLSLLGLFEFRLPTFLLNASARNEGRGGLVGVIFMATTLVITSFTCTVPVVGGLLFLATKGNYLYPIVGMVVFSGVLSLPFFLLALMPGQLSKLPRSGDWMNSVKVVGGLIEIGAALKFLNNAEQGFGAVAQNAWVDSQVMLAAWVVLAAICGLYLLGMFKTDHDHGELRIGPGRMLSGATFLFLALYLAPALFGYPPHSRIYDRMVVGILPLDADELSQSRQILTAMPKLLQQSETEGPRLMAEEASPSERAVPVKATSSDPQVAIRQEKALHGVLWGMSLDEAKEQAKAKNRPILIDFTGVFCPNCRTMEQGVFPKPEIVELMKKFETVQLYVDTVPIESIPPDQRDLLAEENANLQLDLVEQFNQPYYLILDNNGNVLNQIGFAEAPRFQKFLEEGLRKFGEGDSKMARTENPAVGR